MQNKYQAKYRLGFFHQVWTAHAPSESRIDVRKRRSSHVHARILSHVAEEMNCPVTDLVICKSSQGKPFVGHQKIVGSSVVSGIHISISHCPEMSVWTIQPQQCVVDIEPLRPRRYMNALLNRLLHSFDLQHPNTAASPRTCLNEQLSMLSPEHQLVVFYKIWTFAESWCKWHSRTLWKTLRQKIPFPWHSIQHCLDADTLVVSCAMLLTYDRSINHHLLCTLSQHDQRTQS